MKLDDFKLSSLLDFKPQEGRLLLGCDRMLLFRQAAFAFLRKVLHEQLGGRVTHAILSQFGYRCGFGDYEALNTAFSWDTERDQLGCGPLMHGWEGIVAVEPVAMHFDRQRGEFDFAGIWRNSYESEIYLASNEPADHPICSSLTGYASGWCSAFFGQEVLAIEEQCAAMGHDHCRWRVRPVSAWDEQADYWRTALEATNLSIASELEQQVQSRTREISDMLEILRQKNFQLQELDQLKSEFLANVSHELRTPLTLLLGPLQTLLEQELQPAVQNQLQRMQRSGKRLHRLVDQLLDFARCEQKVEVLQAEWVDVGALVAQLVEEAHAQAQNRGILLELALDAEQITANLDVDKFAKIVFNLLGNALKFCRRGDSIRVSLAVRDEYLVLEVSDTGPGIDPGDHELIFQRFRQVDSSARRRHEGTGIGLALVREYAQMHGGRIELHSALGKGARFVVYLPMGNPSMPSALEQEPAASGEWFETDPKSEAVVEPWHADLPLILIAEDHVDLRAYMVSLLADRYRIIQAVNGVQALKEIRNHAPKVVLTDVMMPELDGISLIQILKADPLTQHIPVIVVTARAGSEASSRGLIAGADDYVVKPFAAMELQARVDAAMRMRDLYDRMQERNEALVREISLREKAEADRNHIHKQLLLASREAGRAEVATSILHNAGNLLNSVSTSVATLIGEGTEQPVALLQKIVRLIDSHRQDLGAFFESNKGQSVLNALGQVSEVFSSSQNVFEEELKRVADQVAHLSVIVSQQNDFAKIERFDEPTDLNALMRQAVDMIGLRNMRLRLVEELRQGLPQVVLNRHKALQILFNLLKNAVESLHGIDREPEIIVRTSQARDSVSMEISDNGAGIQKEIMLRIFNSGFTTKPRGNGFGLHASANLAQELGGRLVAFSKGPGSGATFTLWLPLPSVRQG